MPRAAFFCFLCRCATSIIAAGRRAGYDTGSAAWTSWGQSGAAAESLASRPDRCPSVRPGRQRGRERCRTKRLDLELRLVPQRANKTKPSRKPPPLLPSRLTSGATIKAQRTRHTKRSGRPLQLLLCHVVPSTLCHSSAARVHHVLESEARKLSRPAAPSQCSVLRHKHRQRGGTVPLLLPVTPPRRKCGHVCCCHSQCCCHYNHTTPCATPCPGSRCLPCAAPAVRK